MRLYMDYLGNVLDVAPNVSRIDSVGSFFGIAINVAMGVGISIAVIFMILAGIRFITSQGDPKAMEQAKQALTYAVVALVLSMGALALRVIIYNILGADSDILGPVGSPSTSPAPGVPAPGRPGPGVPGPPAPGRPVL